MNEGNRIVENFCVKLKKDVQANLVIKEKEKASKYGSPYNGNSRLWAGIKTNTVIKGENTAYQLCAPKYWYWVDKGRNKGNVSKEGRMSIESWIKRKGLNPVKILEDMREKARIKKGIKQSRKKNKKITFQKAVKQFGFLVQRKVMKKGFEPNHFYSEVINDGRLAKLNEDYKRATKEDLRTAIKESIKSVK